MQSNSVVVISESWLGAEYRKALWNLAPYTNELFRCDRSVPYAKERILTLMLLKIAFKECKGLILFDHSKYNMMWAEC